MEKKSITEQIIRRTIREVEEEKNDFQDFSSKRLAGAQKIVDNAKKKGGPAMLTYYHFVVKLPVYKKASEGKFDVEKSKKELKKLMKEVCSIGENVNIKQIEFQKLVGKIEVLGELIIKSKS